MLTRLALAATFALASALPTGALTCMPPDLARSYNWADERPEIFVLALGSLVRISPDTPDGPADNNPQRRVSYSFPARFEGRLASAEGFNVDRILDVTVEVQCESVWCGGHSLSDYGLYFFRSDGGDVYALEAGLCGGFFFDNPTERQLLEVLGLMR